MCPQVVYERGQGACSAAEEKDGVVIIEHPSQPEKGKVTMSVAEWNAMIKDAKSA